MGFICEACGADVKHLTRSQTTAGTVHTYECTAPDCNTVGSVTTDQDDEIQHQENIVVE